MILDNLTYTDKSVLLKQFTVFTYTRNVHDMSACALIRN